MILRPLFLASFLVLAGLAGCVAPAITGQQPDHCISLGIEVSCTPSKVIEGAGWSLLTGEASEAGTLMAYRIAVAPGQIAETWPRAWFTILPVAGNPTDITEWGVFLFTKSGEGRASGNFFWQEFQKSAGLRMSGFFATGERLQAETWDAPREPIPANFSSNYLVSGLPNFDHHLMRNFLVAMQAEIPGPGEHWLVLAVRGSAGTPFGVAIRPESEYPDGLLAGRPPPPAELLKDIDAQGAVLVEPRSYGQGYRMTQFDWVHDSLELLLPRNIFVHTPDLDAIVEPGLQQDQFNLQLSQASASGGYSLGDGLMFSPSRTGDLGQVPYSPGGKGRWTLEGNNHGAELRGRGFLATESFPVSLATAQLAGYPGWTYSAGGEGPAFYDFNATVVLPNDVAISFYAYDIHFGVPLEDFLGEPASTWSWSFAEVGILGNVPPYIDVATTTAAS